MPPEAQTAPLANMAPTKKPNNVERAESEPKSNFFNLFSSKIESNPFDASSAMKFNPQHNYIWSVIITLLTLVGSPTNSWADAAERLDQLVNQMMAEHPELEQINTQQANDLASSVTFIDVRRAEEYAVSRLPGAVHLTSAEDIAAYAKQHPNQKLVLYCSVGRRSLDMAARLSKQNVAVTNYAGSLFAWANQSLPLENDQGATTEVHPYNWFWGMRYLLDSVEQSQAASLP